MLPHAPQMRINIAEDLGIHMDEVNVKATTTESSASPGAAKALPVKPLRY